MLAMLWSLGMVAWADPGSEIVVILDNSCSMAVETGFNGVQIPPNDPDRLAVLGAAAVSALGSQGSDRVTIIGFGDNATAPALTTVTQPNILDWSYTNGTFFREPLKEADRIFAASQRDAKLLMFLTDGVPSPEDNINSPADMRAIFSPDEHPDVSVLAIGLFDHPEVRSVGTSLLSAITRSADDLQAVDSAEGVVGAFTVGFARAIGSRPETGQLTASSRHQVKVGKYVSEVLAITVSRDPGAPFSAKLVSPWEELDPIGSGSNGCSARVKARIQPELCADPRRHYQVFRAVNNPEHKTEWALSLKSAPGPVEFGIILRYDLIAGLDVPATATAGEPVPISGRLIFKDQTFDDQEFFGSDGFTAIAAVGGEQVPLTHAGGGIFTGTWTPSDDSEQVRTELVEITFSNNWMQQSAQQGLTINPPPYSLVLDGPLTLEPIPSQWGPSTLCGELSMAASRNIEAQEVTCAVSDQPLSVDFTCERSGPTALKICAITERWCCGKSGEITVTAAGPGGTPPRTADSEVVAWKVASPGFFKCYWLPIVLTLSAIVLGWIIWGLIRPFKFDEAASITIAGSEKGLRRATPQLLEECPGGKRGFYRDARVCINGAGDIVRKPKQAAIFIEAGVNKIAIFRKAGGLERRDRRTRKWEALTEEELAEGYMPNILYRMSDLYIRFE
ncbi:MAG: hypothetical protein ACI8RZ_006742 [Myxococcota bacterium]|jgi:hypothetical protein